MNRDRTPDRDAADRIAELTGVARHDLVVVLGSGWSAALPRLGPITASLPTSRLPGFAVPAVPGHSGTVHSVDLGAGRRALVLAGRTHLYEGHGVDAVAHPVRTAAAAGCRVAVLTCGCGGLDPTWPPGTPVLIRDQINLTGASPLSGPQFVDVTDLYPARLRALVSDRFPDLAQGVYVQFRGPQYETPAEVRMAGLLGGHLVGMSTALEAIAAHAAGMAVVGLGLVTNLAAGLVAPGAQQPTPLSHEDVIAAGRAAQGRAGELLAGVVHTLAAATGEQ